MMEVRLYPGFCEGERERLPKLIYCFWGSVKLLLMTFWVSLLARSGLSGGQDLPPFGEPHTPLRREQSTLERSGRVSPKKKQEQHVL